MQGSTSKLRGRPQIVIRKIEYCKVCGTSMPWRQCQGMVLKGKFYQANAKCKHCGALAHLRLV
jgi:hypothetical protein